MKTWIVTGGNRGLGFQIARHLACVDEDRVVLAVRDPALGRSAAAAIGPNVSAMPLDLSRRDSVRQFIEHWQGRIDGLVNNAGTQIGNAFRTTDDGLEQTFAVNHLHTLELTLGLLPALRGGRVVFIGSGTHNPRHPTARLGGFRGERFVSIENAAGGLEQSDNHEQLGKDRYATSKFLNLVTMVELARRIAAEITRFACLDPGLMPGTGLARTSPALWRFGWHYVLPVAARVLPDASTPKRSGRAVAELLRRPDPSFGHGVIYDYKGAPSRRIIERVYDPAIGRAVIDDSLQLLGRESI
ncbi:MAG: SDR family NAD(P)-dependent oxidoreductase [Wenzhouxiangellaceae bacterium]|nr:SDR family NAD(P)-dependent oxidoreductase [Wenzhouxiangellaceae bacterium]